MRRTTVVLGAMLGLLLAPSAASAKPPIANCPHVDAGYFPGWQPVDKQLWWERTVAGFEAEDIDVYQPGVTGNPDHGFTASFDTFATDAGFDGAYGLWYYVWWTQWEGIDHNGDGIICMKDRPHSPGNPAYFFNGVDNSMH
jgi:hypothetical protein